MLVGAGQLFWLLYKSLLIGKSKLFSIMTTQRTNNVNISSGSKQGPKKAKNKGHHNTGSSRSKERPKGNKGNSGSKKQRPKAGYPRRTLPGSVTARHLAGSSRVGRASTDDNWCETSVTPPLLSGRPDNRKDFTPSHVQVCEMIARCLPEKSYGDMFRNSFLPQNLSVVDGEEAKNPIIVDYQQDDNDMMEDAALPSTRRLLCRTPLIRIRKALQEVFGHDRVHISMVNSPEEVKAGGVQLTNRAQEPITCNWLQFFLMDCVLERQLKPSRDEGTSNTTPIKVQAYSEFDMQPEADPRFRTAIAVIPDASLFYCVRDRHPTFVSIDDQKHHTQNVVTPDVLLVRPLLALDIGDLRLRRHNISGPPELWFAKGGYVRRVTLDAETSLPLVWRISILSASPTDDNYQSNSMTTMTMFERPDAFGTAFPPDIFPSELRAKFGYPAGSVDNDRALFNAALRASPSSRLGCRHYVSGALHQKIPPTALVIQPKLEGSFDIRVVIQKPQQEIHLSAGTEHTVSSLGVECESIIKVRW